MGNRYAWSWRLSDIPEPDAGAPTVFSAFACGGGSSMGYKRAGFRVVGNCEIDPRMMEVYKSNLHPAHPYLMDLRDFNRLDRYPDELMALDVLDGSPPCTTFSSCGARERYWGKEKAFREGQATQRLDDLFMAYLDTLERLRPKAFVAENVAGLVKGNAKGYVNEIVGRCRDIGYGVQAFLLDSSAMDVPQRRERVFLIGNRMGWPRLRLAFHGDPIPFGEARTEGPGRPLSPSLQELFDARRPEDTALDSICMRLRGKGSFFNDRICHDDRVADTLTSQCGAHNIRACDGTFITAGDARNCSTFPQDYDFGGQSPFYICGMSVPPNMMANIAREIRAQWLDG